MANQYFDIPKLGGSDGGATGGGGGGGSGTVTSVGFASSGPSIYNITGSPVTTAGTITEQLIIQSSGIVFAGPATGTNSVAPSFRQLVGTDIPSINLASTASAGGVTGILPVSNGGSSSATFGLNALLTGQGENPFGTIPPNGPTSGQTYMVLVSNGTTWQSSAITFGNANQFTVPPTPGLNNAVTWGASNQILQDSLVPIATSGTNNSTLLIGFMGNAYSGIGCTYIGTSGPTVQAGASTNLSGGNNTIIGVGNSMTSSALTNITIIGTSNTANSAGLAIGRSCQANGGNSIALGLTTIGASNNISIGNTCNITGGGSIGLGQNATDGAKTGSIIMGNVRVSSSANFCVGVTFNNASTGMTNNFPGNISFGTPGSGAIALTDMYIGKGALGDANPVNASIQPSPASTGTINVPGANFTIKGGISTGLGAGGQIIFQTSPAATSGTGIPNASMPVCMMDPLQNSTFLGAVGSNIQYSTTAANITINNSVNYFILEPGSTTVSQTITMPSTAINGQYVMIAGGNTAGAVVTTATVAANAGQTLLNSPATIATNTCYGWVFRTANTTWYRIQ